MNDTVDLLIDNAVVLTLDDQRRLIWDGAIAISGKEIVDVGSSADLKDKYQPVATINSRNKLAMPGLINSHSHISGALSRGMINDVAFAPWLDKKRYISSQALDEESYYVSTMLICLEMLKSGTTCFVDCGTFAGLEGVAARAIAEIGIKAVLASSHGREETPVEEELARGEAFIARYNGSADGRIQAWLYLLRVSAVPDELCRQAAQLAKKKAVGILIHASVTADDVERCVEMYGVTPIERMNSLGCLRPNFLAAHMGWITEREMHLLKETGSSITHCPSASMKCAYGSLSMGKFPELIAMGVNVGLGSDGPSASSFQDMVRVMHLAAVGHKEARLDPRVITPEEAVAMATVNNARALLWEDRIGSLEVGKRADIVLFDLMRPEWVPWNEKNIVSNLVYSASGSSVDTVIIDGKVVVEDGVVTTVDEREVLEKAQRASRKVHEVADRWEGSRPGAAVAQRPRAEAARKT